MFPNIVLNLLLIPVILIELKEKCKKTLDFNSKDN